MRWYVAALALAAVPTVAAYAQTGAEMRTVAGKVMKGFRAGPVPVVGAWVVVHRIETSESGKVGGAPVDSARTNASGIYSIRYRTTGDQNTMYIGVTTYAGISYITSPLRNPRVTGDDAALMVFDTTSPPYPLHLGGRHFVISAPGDDGRRRVIEVYQLLNDSTKTVVGSEANPAFTATLPAGVTDFRLDQTGDITAETVKQVGDHVIVFAPIGPGMRQVAFSYTLPATAFPLSIPVEDGTQLFEVLVQDPSATIAGGGLTEVAPVAQDGQVFRRLLAQDVGKNAVVRFTMPTAMSTFVKQGAPIIASVIAGVMALALGFVALRRRRARVVPGVAVDRTEALVRQLATLDADFERHALATDDDRAAFLARRSALKRELTTALADRNGAV